MRSRWAGVVLGVCAGWAIAAELPAQGAAAAPPVAGGAGVEAPAPDRPAVEVPVMEYAGYLLCANEANDAMTLGRMLRMFPGSREAIAADPQLPPYLRAMAGDLFRAVDSGEAPTYAHFARSRFATCLQQQEVPLPAGDTQMLVCLTRLDIPYFFYARRLAGESIETALPRVKAELAGWEYPEGLVEALAGPSMSIEAPEQVRVLQFFLLNSCLFPAGEVGAYYGFDWPLATPADRPATKAPPARPPRKK